MTCIWQSKNHASAARPTLSTWTITTLSRYAQIHAIPPRPTLTPRCEGPARVTAAIYTLRVRVVPPTHCARFARLYVCAHILLFNVCLLRTAFLERDSNSSIHSLPKDKIPIREGAVASLASILGGFGVVALFCAVGVNM